MSSAKWRPFCSAFDVSSWTFAVNGRVWSSLNTLINEPETIQKLLTHFPYLHVFSIQTLLPIIYHCCVLWTWWQYHQGSRRDRDFTSRLWGWQIAMRACVRPHKPWDAITYPCPSATGSDGAYVMMTSSNGNIFRVTGPLCGEFTGHRWIPSQRPVTRSFGVFFDLRLNKRLSKQQRCWWFETPSRSLWRHCNARPYMAWVVFGGVLRPMGQKCHIEQIVINGCTGSFKMTTSSAATDDKFVNMLLMMTILLI